MQNGPIFYLVATPIGNLTEFSPRAKEVLNTVDAVFCEDTRHTGLLLKAFDIKKPLISCFEHNENEKAELLLNYLREGKSVAYCSDAGYPLISDPGQRLVQKVLDNDFFVSVISGPSAFLNALCGSGLDTEHFYFYGFLKAAPNERRKELESLKDFPSTMIFYEAPHRLISTLRDMEKIFGGDRKAVLARELTKKHEEYIRGTLSEILSSLHDEKGEFVILIEKGKSLQKSYKEEDIVNLLKEELKDKKSKEAVKKVAEITKLNSHDIYDLYLKYFR